MDNPPQAEGHPMFSVVIPTYNRAATVCRAIDSVLAQTYKAAEVIVVDDGSQDATPDRVAACGNAVRYVYQANAGAAAARNHGAREACFPWLAFLDSDDIWFPGYLEKMAAAIRETAGAAMLYFSDADFEAFPPPKNRWSRVAFAATPPHELLKPPVNAVFAEGQPMLLPFSVFQRAGFLAAGGLWERLSAGEDTHMYARLGLHHQMCAVSFTGGLVKGSVEDAARLTGEYGPRTIRRWDSAILLWKDLLKKESGLGPEYRRLLVRRVADAFWRKCLLQTGQHDFLGAMGSLGNSLLNDPSVAFTAAARKLYIRP
jgi:hypothetical protein